LYTFCLSRTDKTYVRVIAGAMGPVGDEGLRSVQGATGYVQLG